MADMVNATFAAIFTLVRMVRSLSDRLLVWYMVANVAFSMFASDLLWRKHMFATSLRCANLM